ncbi:MAG TPA: hypothetical protein VLV86_13630 [Vicinamibacterales bacterium]|nr:hypothetical protein [Vicinamibacterales bacterium]
MPSDDGLGLEHDGGRLPAPPHAGEQYPDHPISGAETRSLHAPLQHVQLMAERHLLEHDIPMFATGDGDRPPDQQHELEHTANCCGSGFAKSTPVPGGPNSGERQA